MKQTRKTLNENYLNPKKTQMNKKPSEGRQKEQIIAESKLEVEAN